MTHQVFEGVPFPPRYRSVEGCPLIQSTDGSRMGVHHNNLRDVRPVHSFPYMRSGQGPSVVHQQQPNGVDFSHRSFELPPLYDGSTPELQERTFELDQSVWPTTGPSHAVFVYSFTSADSWRLISSFLADRYHPYRRLTNRRNAQNITSANINTRLTSRRILPRSHPITYQIACGRVNLLAISCKILTFCLYSTCANLALRKGCPCLAFTYKEHTFQRDSSYVHVVYFSNTWFLTISYYRYTNSAGHEDSGAGNDSTSANSSVHCRGLLILHPTYNRGILHLPMSRLHLLPHRCNLYPHHITEYHLPPRICSTDRVSCPVCQHEIQRCNLVKHIRAKHLHFRTKCPIGPQTFSCKGCGTEAFQRRVWRELPRCA